MMSVASVGALGLMVLGCVACSDMPSGAPTPTNDGAVATDSGAGPMIQDAGRSQPQPIDPAVALARACPAGANVRVQLWDALATPRRPDGEPWDGNRIGLNEFICPAAAERIRQLTRQFIDAKIGAVGGALLDRYVGEEFQRAVSQLCNAGANWLQMRFEGPDMFANALATNGAVQWTSVQVEDAWLARLERTSQSAPAAWQAPCDGQRYVGTVRVTDSDLAFNDEMATMSFEMPTRSPGVLCDGWGYLDGESGVVGMLFRVTVDRPQQCEGITGASLDDLEIRKIQRQRVPTASGTSEGTIEAWRVR